MKNDKSVNNQPNDEFNLTGSTTQQIERSRIRYSNTDYSTILHGMQYTFDGT